MRYLLIVLTISLAACASSPKPSEVSETELDAKLQQASVAYNEGRLSDAERLLNQILGNHPSLYTAWFKLGNIHYRMGRFDAAVRAYEMTLKYDRQHTWAWHNLALTRVKQAMTVIETGKKALPEDSPDFELLVNLQQKLLGRFETNVASDGVSER